MFSVEFRHTAQITEQTLIQKTPSPKHSGYKITHTAVPNYQETEFSLRNNVDILVHNHVCNFSHST